MRTLHTFHAWTVTVVLLDSHSITTGKSPSKFRIIMSRDEITKYVSRSAYSVFKTACHNQFTVKIFVRKWESSLKVKLYQWCIKLISWSYGWQYVTSTVLLESSLGGLRFPWEEVGDRAMEDNWDLDFGVSVMLFADWWNCSDSPSFLAEAAAFRLAIWQRRQ